MAQVAAPGPAAAAAKRRAVKLERSDLWGTSMASQTAPVRHGFPDDSTLSLDEAALLRC
jgi:hypothetical protein